MDTGIILGRAVVGPLETNCYLLGCGFSRKAVIIDPGADPEKIKKKITELEIEPIAVILTHGHYDHIGCLDEFDLPVYVHEQDIPMIKDSNKNLSAVFSVAKSFDPDIRVVEDGQIINVGHLGLTVIYTPGHTMGGISIAVEKLLFSGDTLFCRGIGRTDLPGGSFEMIRKSITEKLFAGFDDDVKVFPGHGPDTTIGQEKQGSFFYE